jgi:hypothetical protein
VLQLVAGNVATQSVVAPEAKVTVPVAAPGSPVSARRAVPPESMVSADVNPSAVMANDVGVVPKWGLSAPVPLAGLALVTAGPAVAGCPWPVESATDAFEFEEGVDDRVVVEAAPDPRLPEDGVPDVGDAAGAVTAGVAEVPLVTDESAPECETARKMATAATTPMAAPNAIRRGPRPARRVKGPPTVVDSSDMSDTCPLERIRDSPGEPLQNVPGWVFELWDPPGPPRPVAGRRES